MSFTYTDSNTDSNTEAPSEPHKQAIVYLRSTQAIRDRCGLLFELACQDQLRHFRCDLEQLDRVADYVIQVMQAQYPDWQIPFHSRWRHFEAGGISRLAQLDNDLAVLTPLERARAKFDLAVTSVLLDAGAGATWRYAEPGTDQILGRSEGLAVASFHLFRQGGFSSDRNLPYQADATGLQSLTESNLIAGLQVNDQNPLVGVAGRTKLMQRLGQVLQALPHLFGTLSPRPGGLVDYLLQQAPGNSLNAHTVFAAVLEGFSEIWPGRVTIASVNLGDVWGHPILSEQVLSKQESAQALEQAIDAHLVPFHKLSQWLTYSLLEPLQELGVQITNLDNLTGLAEYRNGGLCVDLGLLQPKHEQVLSYPHTVDSEVIVEWRALTVICLDRIAATIRSKLGLSETEFPLAKVLEGGTWAAGRQIAATLRPRGIPPIQVISDGTVF